MVHRLRAGAAHVSWSWRRRLKRAADIVVAGVGLLLLAPLLAALALLIKLDSAGPALFRQQRVGRGGRAFRLLKIRSMIDRADFLQATLGSRNEACGPIFKMREDPRMTRLGRVLRRTSLDEIPQLYNVLVGDMSLVGPRPPTPSEVKRYEPWHYRRLEVVPGLTGLAQVSGRSDLSFDEVVRLDSYYIDHWSLKLDAMILLRTIPRVLARRGAY
jgi:exopolysaccharide biosynthesis polyprenyl glycosylphosphotransferase